MNGRLVYERLLILVYLFRDFYTFFTITLTNPGDGVLYYLECYMQYH